MVSRSSAAGNSSIPPTANIVSGNTSVCITPALVASFSATLPATAEACGVNAPVRAPWLSDSDPVRMRRSAISRMPRTPTSRIVPCRNSAGASTATAPSDRGVAGRAVQLTGQLHHRDERGDQAHQADHTWTA